MQSEGGEQLIGWTIWSADVLVEAEFHAVWKDPSGALIDIAPKANGEAHILFLPDPSRQYTGRQVDNIRAARYTNDVLVERFIRVSEQIFEVMNRGERAEQHGMVTVSAHEYAPLVIRKELIGRQILSRKISPDGPCVCGRPRKLKRCCGRS